MLVFPVCAPVSIDKNVLPRMQLLSIDDEGFVSLLDELLGTKEDLKLPESELGKQIREEFEKNEGGMLVSAYLYGVFASRVVRCS